MTEDISSHIAALDAAAAGSELRQDRRAAVRLRARRGVRPRAQPADRHARELDGAPRSAGRARQQHAALHRRTGRAGTRWMLSAKSHPTWSSARSCEGSTCRPPRCCFAESSRRDPRPRALSSPATPGGVPGSWTTNSRSPRGSSPTSHPHLVFDMTRR